MRDEASDPAGERIAATSLAGTALFVVVGVLALLWPRAFGALYVGVAVGMFLSGAVAFLWAYGIAISRSRDSEISVANLFLLTGPVPAPMRARLRGALAVQVVAGLAFASLRIYTAMAFGVLVPMFGLGLAGLWAARHGEFPPRAGKSAPRT